MKHESTARMLLSFFNITFGTRYKFSDHGEMIDAAINEEMNNISEIKAYIRKAHNDDATMGIKEVFAGYTKTAVHNEVEEKPQHDAEAQQDNSPLASSINIFSNAVAAMVAQMKVDEIKATVASTLHDDIDQYISNTYGKIERKVTLVSEFGKHEVQGITHAQFDTVLEFIANNEPVYLTGAAGTGKNVLCKQVADALGLDFYFTNAVTQEYKLTGFTDANGIFHGTQFYEAFTKGGLFMLDEMDASIPEVLIILNAAIANRYFDFPAPIGKVSAHPNFRVIAAGNTCGHGADSAYVGRNTLDAASLDRFAMIHIDYDERIEMAVTNNNTELVQFCRAFRKAANKNGLAVTVSYRAMSRMAKMERLLDKVTLLQTCLIKGLDKDDLKMMLETLKGYGEYTIAYEKCIQSAE